MKTWLAGIVLFAACLWGQPVNVETALTALLNPKIDRAVAARQLTDAMKPLADANRQPSRSVIDDFAKELAFALAGKKLNRAEVANINACLVVVMKGEISNLRSTSMLQHALSNAGIAEFEMGVITRRFVAIGEELRGPDDLRLTKVK